MEWFDIYYAAIFFLLSKKIVDIYVNVCKLSRPVHYFHFTSYLTNSLMVDI